MTTYRTEFGPAWPVPPITVDFTDRTAAARKVAEHAIPHLRPVLAAKGRPELADCFFQTNRELTAGQFMWLDLTGEKAARFCPARLTPQPDPIAYGPTGYRCGCGKNAHSNLVPCAPDVDPDICGDQYDDEVCDLDPGHDGDHCANATVGWPATPSA